MRAVEEERKAKERAKRKGFLKSFLNRFRRKKKRDASSEEAVLEDEAAVTTTTTTASTLASGPPPVDALDELNELQQRNSPTIVGGINFVDKEKEQLRRDLGGWVDSSWLLRHAEWCVQRKPYTTTCKSNNSSISFCMTRRRSPTIRR